MKRWIIVLILLCFMSAAAQFDQPALSDSTGADSLNSWSDTSAFITDSTVHQASFRHGWLFPVGLVALTFMGFLMLFTTRSR